MNLQGFEINGVLIKTPQALSVVTRIEKQTVKLLSGKPKSRIKRIYRVVTLHYSMLEQDDATVILNNTIKKAVDDGSLEVTLKFMDEYGTMQTMAARFSDFGFRAIAESVMNNRWAEIDELVFEEV